VQNWRRRSKRAPSEVRSSIVRHLSGCPVRRQRRAIVPAESLADILACHICCRRTELLDSRRSRSVETNRYLHTIGSSEKSSSTIIKTMPRSTSIRADFLSVPKTIGTGPIMMTPPPRTRPVPLADFKIATKMASIASATPPTARISPMLKRRLSANSGSRLTVSRDDIGFPRTTSLLFDDLP